MNNTAAGASPVDCQVRPHRTPRRDEVERLMKRCQIGVGGRAALENAHSIMAECYGTLGLLMQCVEWYRNQELALRVAAQMALQAYDDGSDIQSSMDRLERLLDAA